MLTIIRAAAARISASLIGDDIWGEPSRQACLPGGPADTVTMTAPAASPLATVETTAPARSWVVFDTTVSGWSHDGVYATRDEAVAVALTLPGRDTLPWAEFAREARDSSALVQVVTGGRVRALDI